MSRLSRALLPALKEIEGIGDRLAGYQRELAAARKAGDIIRQLHLQTSMYEQTTMILSRVRRLHRLIVDDKLHDRPAPKEVDGNR